MARRRADRLLMFFLKIAILVGTVQYALQELCNAPIKKWSLCTVLLKLGRTLSLPGPQSHGAGEIPWQDHLGLEIDAQGALAVVTLGCSPLPSPAGLEWAKKSSDDFGLILCLTTTK